MKNLIQIALGLVCVGFACSFDEQQKKNAIAGNDKFSKFIWSADQSMNVAVGTGLIVNGADQSMNVAVGTGLIVNGIANIIMNNNHATEKAIEELVVNNKI